MTGGNVGEAPFDSNYSAGNPNYVRLKLNPEKFKIARIPAFAPFASAAYDPFSVSVGAFDASSSANGKKRVDSWMQIAAVSKSTGVVSVAGNFPAPSAAEVAS